MDDPEQTVDFLNQEWRTDSLFSYLVSSDHYKHILIRGLSGTGKTFIAGEIAGRWEGHDPKNVSLFLNGDLSFSASKYHPFIDGLSRFKSKKDFSNYLISGAGELSKGIPFVGDFVGYLIETLGSAKEAAKRNDLRYLNQIEKQLVFDFNRLFKGRRLLIAVDNIQWFDEQSLGFMKTILSPVWNDHFPLFSKIHFLFILTESQEVIAEKQLQELLVSDQIVVVKTKPITENDYLNVLKKFGFNGDLGPDLINLLFSFTGGNLVLIKRLAEYLSEQLNTESAVYFFDDASDSGYSFIEHLLLYKLKDLGASGEQITALLELAAVIGFSFEKEELLCLSKEQEGNLKMIINAAAEIQLLDNTESKTKFSHDILRQFFFNRLADKKYTYYRAFAECLKKLRPADYATRGRYLFESGDLESATIINISNIFKNIRESLTVNQQEVERTDFLSFGFNLNDYLTKMQSAYESYLITRYTDAINTLQQIEDWLPKALLAEKYYLLALCASKSMLKGDLQRAREYLTGWDELKEEEGEIWTRLMTILMTIHINLYDYDSARMIEKKIIFYLAERVRFDPWATHTLNVIRRNSTTAHINDIACTRTQQSVAYFTAQLDKPGLGYPIQLYYSLTNHAANLIVAGNYASAFKYAGEALALINNLIHISFPEPQISANNYILSGILSNNIPYADGLNMFELIAPYEGFVADEILIKNNHAIMQVYNDQTELAFHMLSQLYELCRSNEIDSYYTYVVGINLAALYYLKNMDKEFANLWKKLKNLIPKIPDVQYLEKRHELLWSARGKIDRSWRSWNNYLLTEFPHTLGNSWTHYGKGFLFSDIQLWFES